jgi:2-polyprenyl-6-methoxyphenol hydroxylase-like FAD-dependent oxidoreductase
MMTKELVMYDVIVVGARCAGSPTAMLLARKGYRVLLVDKAGFPSDTLSAHYIHQPGTAALQRWGLLDRVAATNCPPVYKLTFDLGFFALSGEPTPFDGVGVGYSPRRTVLDQLLVNAAVEAGVELREHFSVQELLTDGERVTGIRGHAAGGATVTEQAPLVIGADGMRSFVAKSVQAANYHEVPSLTCTYYTYFSDVPVDGTELYGRPDNTFIAVHTNDGQTMVIAYWRNSEFHRVRSNIEENFMQVIDFAPGLSERVRAGKRSEPFRGTADLPNFFRQAYGAGWALVGDAGYHKDPILAHGIMDSFQDAERLAEAVDAGLSSRQPMQDALAEYQRARDEAMMPRYQMTIDQAKMAPPPPEMQQLLGALRGNQAQINRFFGVFAGSVPPQEFFAPENIGQIMMAAAGAPSLGWDAIVG